MGKWYVQTGDIQEVIHADGRAEAFCLGLRKSLDRARHYDDEVGLGILIMISEKGFPVDLEEFAEGEVFVSVTSEVLRRIGEDEMAEVMEEFQDGRYGQS